MSEQLEEYAGVWTTVKSFIPSSLCSAVHTKTSYRYMEHKVCNEAVDTEETGNKLAPKGNRVVFRDTQIIVTE